MNPTLPDYLLINRFSAGSFKSGYSFGLLLAVSWGGFSGVWASDPDIEISPSGQPKVAFFTHDTVC